VVYFYTILKSWLGTIEDCSAFVDQIQILPYLCMFYFKLSSLQGSCSLLSFGGGGFYIYFPPTFSFSFFSLFLFYDNEHMSVEQYEKYKCYLNYWEAEKNLITVNIRAFTSLPYFHMFVVSSALYNKSESQK